MKSLAIIGPNADSVRNLLGDYNYASGNEGQVGMYKSFADKAQNTPLEEDILKSIKQYEGYVLLNLYESTGASYDKMEDLPEDLLKQLIQGFIERAKDDDSQKKLKSVITLMQEQGLDRREGMPRYHEHTRGYSSEGFS